MPRSPRSPRTNAWVDIAGYIGARVWAVETTHNGRRLIVRGTLNESDQPTLVEDWRHHAFLTHLKGDLLEVDRTHAVVELGIRDLKQAARLRKPPRAGWPAGVQSGDGDEAVTS